MTGLESLLWQMGGAGSAGARFAPTMTLAVVLDAPVRVPALLNRLDRVVSAVPRLGCVPSVPALGAVPPRWEPDPAFAVERHVRVSRDPFSEILTGVLCGGFVAGQPPWSAVVAAGEPLVVFHLHHSYTDGLGGLALLGELMDFGAEGPAAGGDPEEPVRAGRDAMWEIAHHARTVARALPWAGRTLVGSLTQPSSVLGPAGDLAASLGAHARAAVGPASPALAARSQGAAVARIDLDLPTVRGVSRRLGVTVNDVYVAGLLDGLARYHVKRGARAPSLRLGLPISSRTAGAELMTNQLLGAVLRAPLGQLDFGERARLVHEMVVIARRQPWAAVADDIGDLLSRVPGSARVVSAAISSLDVLASNVTGPDVPMSLVGSPVSSMLPIGPRAGAAVNATLLSYCGLASIGLNIDSAAVPDPAVMVDCLGAAFDEGLAG